MKSMRLITLASHGVPCGIKPNLVKYGDLKSPTALHATSQTSFPSKKDEMDSYNNILLNRLFITHYESFYTVKKKLGIMGVL